MPRAARTEFPPSPEPRPSDRIKLRATGEVDRRKDWLLPKAWRDNGGWLPGKRVEQMHRNVKALNAYLEARGAAKVRGLDEGDGRRGGLRAAAAAVGLSVARMRTILRWAEGTRGRSVPAWGQDQPAKSRDSTTSRAASASRSRASGPSHTRTK